VTSSVSSVSVAVVDLPVADERNVFLFVVYLLNILLNFHFMVSVHFKHYTSGFVLLVLAKFTEFTLTSGSSILDM